MARTSVESRATLDAFDQTKIRQFLFDSGLGHCDIWQRVIFVSPLLPKPLICPTLPAADNDLSNGLHIRKMGDKNKNIHLNAEGVRFKLGHGKLPSSMATSWSYTSTLTSNHHRGVGIDLEA